MPEPGFSALLAGLIAVPLGAGAELRGEAGGGESGGALVARSRREAILSAGAALFAQRGFTGVSVDDIGTAVGIAGPSVYNHFAAKTDILVAAMFRGNELLWANFNRAVADAPTSPEPCAAWCSAIRPLRLPIRTSSNCSLPRRLNSQSPTVTVSGARSAPISTNGSTWRDN
ncbi:TetR/AcrR family transcriptional regulator [Mycobacterium paraseoulense]|uniref:TetR/AcrR family transcriptional regulator n=1 Tax=Mycobacterium paraseoulense TaxID=590652 RepID=UPI00138B5EF8|nr:TetR/AcrR family transcriptional regulator [Mycobacterium paraseoulense]BBZ74640.1 hypothetical protein MPRS_57330 [Mycobacterium paraseoulense]